MTTCQEGATHTKDLRLLRKAAEEGLLYLDVVPLPFVLEIQALVKEYAPDCSGAPMELPEHSAEVYAKGVQVFCHANGDAAIELAIEDMHAVGATAADDRRTVIIHSQCMRPDQLDPYVELDISPSFFTTHTFYWGDEHLVPISLRSIRIHCSTSRWRQPSKRVRRSTARGFTERSHGAGRRRKATPATVDTGGQGKSVKASVWRGRTMVK